MSKNKLLKIELVKSGIIQNNSGELVIIDPCYLASSGEINFDEIREEIDRIDSDPQIKFLEALKESREDFDKLKERFASEPSFNYPHFIQGDGYVMFRTGVGDGLFPVTRTQRKLHVNFSRLKNPSKSGLLSRVSVDSGNLICVDHERVQVKNDVNAELYCRFSCPQGAYSCRYVRNGKLFSMGDFKE